MNLFLDTNILLNFYHMSGEDVEELKKLIASIEAGKITLWTTQQVIDEYHRNRDGKINLAMKDLKKAALAVHFPAFSKGYPEFKAIQENLKEAEKLRSELQKKLLQDVENHRLPADEIISLIFGRANCIHEDESLIELALKRHRCGNPPGKNDKRLGDEINWEALLLNLPNDADLHLVADDKDYYSDLFPDKPHAFLEKEWSEQKNGQLRVYGRIGSFFEEHFPEIKLADDVERGISVNELVASSSFQTTHNAIAKLGKFENFTEGERERLIEAAIYNDQINWILDDPDIAQFYERLFGSANLALLSAMMRSPATTARRSRMLYINEDGSKTPAF